MNHNKSIKNKNGIIAFCAYDDCGYGRINDPYELARIMSTGDFLDIFAACEGDFLLLEQNTRKAMVIKGQDLNGNYKERLSRQAIYRKEREKRRHNEIMAEIRELMADKKNFTVIEVQLAAVNRGNGFPVRTRQMYTSHLRQAVEENIVENDFSDSSVYINVILRDGRKSSQRIPDIKWRRVYKFIQ